jgi:hypothetical protein
VAIAGVNGTKPRKLENGTSCPRLVIIAARATVPKSGIDVLLTAGWHPTSRR